MRRWQALCYVYLVSQRNQHHIITIPGLDYYPEGRHIVQSMIETERNYEGITQDERIALRQFIDIKVEESDVQEQFSDVLLLQGPTK